MPPVAAARIIGAKVIRSSRAVSRGTERNVTRNVEAVSPRYRQTSERYGEKYQGNLVSATTNARLDSKKTANDNRSITNAKREIAKDTSTSQAQATKRKTSFGLDSLGRAVAVAKQFQPVWSLAAFLLLVHSAVLWLTAAALLGYALEWAAVSFFEWIPLVGETIGSWVGELVPGMEMAAITQGGVALVGWASLLAILIVMYCTNTLPRHDAWLLMAAICSGAYLIPGISFIPWYGVFVLYAVYVRLFALEDPL